MGYRERFAVKPAVTVQSGRIDSNDKGRHDDTDSATDFVDVCPTPCTRTPVVVRLR